MFEYLNYYWKQKQFNNSLSSPKKKKKKEFVNFRLSRAKWKEKSKYLFVAIQKD